MRNRAYLRKMRAKHIRRKKRMVSPFGYGWSYPHDGMYSKGKIHCSCGMCMAKTRNKGRRSVAGNYAPSLNWKHSDLLKIQSMNDDLKEFNQSS